MNQKDTIQRTGQLMLQGWKLLALSCPVCNTALLSNKLTGEMLCPGCNLPVKDERATSAHSFPIHAQSSNEIDGEDDEDEDDEDYSFHSSSRIVSYEATNNRLNNISGKLGEKLLKGWTMRAESCLDSSCRGTPLMQENASTPLLCVCCNRDYELKNGVLALIPLETSTNSTTQVSAIVDAKPVNLTPPVAPSATSSLTPVTKHEPLSAIEIGNNSSVWSVARTSLEKKLLASCQELEKTQNVSTSIDLTNLIIKLTEALRAVGSTPN